MGIKRWKLYSDYGDSAMCETGNQPAGHWHPVSEDDYVLHADHAAEVARLEARVAELEWANGYASKVVGKLRAQLEAAKADAELIRAESVEAHDANTALRSELADLRLEVARQYVLRLCDKALNEPPTPAPAPSECYACKYSQGPHTHKREGI